MYSIYEKEFSITDNMCGKNQIIKPSGVLDILQSIAGEHANILHIGFNDIYKLNLAFVLARVKYDLIKPIYRYSKVRVITWPLQANKIDMDRDFEIYDLESGELLLKASSKWILIDITTRRICRSNVIEYPTNIYPKVNYDSFDKLKFDNILFTYEYDYEVRYSDLDLNDHMNNTKYSEAIKFDRNNLVTHCQIDYLHEVKYQDVLKIKAFENGNELFAEGSCNGVSFRTYYKFLK